MPKLPKGMYRRGKAYYCRLFRGNQEYRRSLGSEYEGACAKLKRLKRSEEPWVTEEVTVAQAIPRWLATAIRNGRNAQGLRDATARSERYLKVFAGHLRVSRIKQDDLREFRTWLEDRGASPSLVHHVLTDARHFFRWCAAAGLTSRAPIPERWLPRLQERPPDRLSAEEVAAVSAVPDPYGFVVRLAIGTGLRWGELSRLDSSDIWNGVVVVKETKSGRVRRVPLPPGIAQEVATKNGRIVPFSDAKTVTVQVRKYSGVKRFHMHQTRHTFACAYLERGGSLHALQQLLGHSTVLVTQRYARLSDEAILAEHRRIHGLAQDKPAQKSAQAPRPRRSCRELNIATTKN